MQQSQEDKEALHKAAHLAAVFDQGLGMDSVERILKTKGDINYRIPKCSLNYQYEDYAGATALHFTRRYNDTDMMKAIRLLVKYGADITVQSDEKETALHNTLDKVMYFGVSDDWELRGKLLKKAINEYLSTHVKKSITKNPSDKHGLTHLHIACMADHCAAVELFLRSGVPVDLVVKDSSKTFPKCTPLLVAVKLCALEAAKVLIQHGANLYFKDKNGMNAVHWLVERCRRIIDFLVLEDNERPKDWFTYLPVHQQTLTLLLNRNKINSRIIIDEIGLSDLHVACTVGDASLAEEFLTRAADINHQVHACSHLWPGYTALHFAAHFDLETVKLLLSKGANIMIKDASGKTPLDICLERYAIKDIYFIMSMQPSWESITLVDGKTRLLDLILFMEEISHFVLFLDNYVDDINTPVSMDSPLWPGYTPLHLAVLLSERTKCRSNYTFVQVRNSHKPEFRSTLELVEECLSRGADVTAEDPLGCTPLHLAFRHQKTDTIKRLLNFHRSSANPIDKYNVSLLHIACAAGDEGVVERLLESGAEFNVPVLSNFKFCRRSNDNNVPSYVGLIPAGSTPLHIAVASRSLKIVKMLVNKGADVNAFDENGVTPTHRIFIEANLEDVNEIGRILSSVDLKDIVVGKVGLSHLHATSHFGDVDATKRLLDVGADVDARMSDESTLEKFQALYCPRESNLSFDAGKTALHLAKAEVEDVLLKHGADILAKNAKGYTVMHGKIYGEFLYARLESIIEFLSQNEDLVRRVEENTGLTVLHMATRQLDAVAVARLIESGANVNARMYDSGCTPLHLLMGSSWIISYDQSKREDAVEILKILLAAGADVTLCDAKGNTPPHSIIRNGKCHDEFQRYLVNLMLDHLKDFHANIVGEQGLSLFHIACLKNNVPVIKKFVEHGIDINAPVNYFNDAIATSDFESGCSALHIIMKSHKNDQSLPQIETIDFLLENGADVNAQSVEKNTPLDFAVYYVPDRLDIIERLIRAGADCQTSFEALLISRKSTPEVIQLFMEHGCNVNGFTSVHQHGYLALPLYDSRDEPDYSISTMETLFMSPEISNSDAEGRTAIHNIVSVCGNYVKKLSAETYRKLIARLCSMGCDVDSQDHAGKTALHFAARFNNDIAIDALLMNGADIHVIDECGKTAFAYCLESREANEELDERDWHFAAMSIFYNHISKMRYFNLDPSSVNRLVLLKADLLYEGYSYIIDRMDSFGREIDHLKVFVLEEGSISFRLGDLFSETGFVAAYPHMGYDRRLVIDTFFNNIDVYVDEYSESIGLLKLQYRKAVKRISLIDPATKSLQVSVGFPFPEFCCRIVLRFLSNSDLEKLILAARDE